jgi:hypothetical protein
MNHSSKLRKTYTDIATSLLEDPKYQKYEVVASSDATTRWDGTGGVHFIHVGSLELYVRNEERIKITVTECGAMKHLVFEINQSLVQPMKSKGSYPPHFYMLDVLFDGQTRQIKGMPWEDDAWFSWDFRLFESQEIDPHAIAIAMIDQILECSNQPMDLIY